MLVAIYCRLSKEDDEKQNESESIQNQKSLLVKYAVEKGWDIYKIYSDDDYSGIDRDRPEFSEMISEASQKKFDIILCKTQSRFTRDMELIEKYLHNKFLLWEIRFVTVVDNVDTEMKGNKKSRQINGLINEWYLEDLSDNIRTVFDHKRSKGEYIGGFPIYGYRVDPQNKNHIVVDETSADVVRQIYSLYLEGNGKQHIANILNQQRILNPAKYKKSIDPRYHYSANETDYGLWNPTSVGRILKNEMYIGNMVQGKIKKVSYKSKKRIHTPQEDWFIVENTHEAIIDKETFATVTQLMKLRTRSDGTGETHILSSKVRCTDCGSVLSKTSSKCNGERRSYLRCRLYATGKSQNLCTRHGIRLDTLTDIVEQKIREYIDKYYEIGDESRFDVKSNPEKEKVRFDKKISELKRQIILRADALKNLYLDKVSGVINDSQFAEMNETFIGEKKNLEQELISLQNETDNCNSSEETKTDTISKIHERLKCKPMSRNLMSMMIDTIEVGEKNPNGEQEIKINWAI